MNGLDSLQGLVQALPLQPESPVVTQRTEELEPPPLKPKQIHRLRAMEFAVDDADAYFLNVVKDAAALCELEQVLRVFKSGQGVNLVPNDEVRRVLFAS